MIVILPKTPRMRFIYGIDMKHHLSGRISTSRPDTKIKDVIPEGPANRLPCLRRFILDSSGVYRIPPGRRTISFMSASYLRIRLLREMGFRIIEEPRRRRPSKMFFLYRLLDQRVSTYFVITSKMVYPPGSEPPSISCNRLLPVGRILLVIS